MTTDPTPIFISLKKLTDESAKFVQRLAELVTTRNWLKLVLLLDTVWLFTFHPGSLVRFLPESFPTPGFRVYWAIAGLLFVGAIAVAIITAPRRSEEIPDTRERKDIKGLRTFEFADAEIFRRLHSEGITRECLEIFYD